MKNKIITNKIKQSQEYKKTRNLALKYTRLNRRILRKLIWCMEDIVVRRYGQVMIIRGEWDGINAKVLFLHRDDNNEDNTFEVTINVNGYVTVIADEILYYQIVHKDILDVPVDDTCLIDVEHNYKTIDKALEAIIKMWAEIDGQSIIDTSYVLDVLKVNRECLEYKIEELIQRDINYTLDNIEFMQICDRDMIESLLFDGLFDDFKLFVRINKVA